MSEGGVCLLMTVAWAQAVRSSRWESDVTVIPFDPYKFILLQRREQVRKDGELI